MSSQELKKKKMSLGVKPLQDKNSLPRKPRNQKVPQGEAPSIPVKTAPVSGKSKQSPTSNAVKMDAKENENCPAPCAAKSSQSVQSTQNEEGSTRPVHIEASPTKPQEQLTMRERLALWKQEKQLKKEMELKSKCLTKKRPVQSAPPSTKKKEVLVKTVGPQQTAITKLERRTTFSVRTGTNMLRGTVKTETKRPAIAEPPENKKPRVSIKKPVLVLSTSKKLTQQPTAAWSKSQRHTNVRRQSAVTRRRLSAGMSKRPVGILKRKSCVPAIGCSSSAPEVATSTEGPKPLVEHTHVKFLTPSQTPTQNHTTFRKTPSKSKDSQCSQDSMRHKLNCWLEAKGKTPSKFRHLICFDAAMSERKKKDSQMTRSITVKQLSEQQEKMATEDSVCQNLMSQFNDAAEVNKHDKKQAENPKGIAEQLDALLKECNQLIETGCPTDTILTWLNNIYDNIALAKYYTPFYRCKVQAVKKCRSHADVIEVLSQAIANSAQPPSELADLNTSVMKEMLSRASGPALIIDTAEQSIYIENTAGVKEDGLSTCQQLKLEDVETGNSVEEEQQLPKEEPTDGDEATEAPFVVQYSVTNVTPFKKRKRAASLCTPQHTQTIVTPVRRSTRRSVHGIITDSEKIVKSIGDLSEVEKNSALFRPNHALDDVLEKYQ